MYLTSTHEKSWEIWEILSTLIFSFRRKWAATNFMFSKVSPSENISYFIIEHCKIAATLFANMRASCNVMLLDFISIKTVPLINQTFRQSLYKLLDSHWQTWKKFVVINLQIFLPSWFSSGSTNLFKTTKSNLIWCICGKRIMWGGEINLILIIFSYLLEGNRHDSFLVPILLTFKKSFSPFSSVFNVNFEQIC